MEDLDDKVPIELMGTGISYQRYKEVHEFARNFSKLMDPGLPFSQLYERYILSLTQTQGRLDLSLAVTTPNKRSDDVSETKDNGVQGDLLDGDNTESLEAQDFEDPTEPLYLTVVDSLTEINKIESDKDRLIELANLDTLLSEYIQAQKKLHSSAKKFNLISSGSGFMRLPLMLWGIVIGANDFPNHDLQHITPFDMGLQAVEFTLPFLGLTAVRVITLFHVENYSDRYHKLQQNAMTCIAEFTQNDEIES